MSNQAVDTRLLGWVGSPAVYFVDSARGDDDNSGKAIEAPLRTISAALLLAKAETLDGAVVLLAPGSTYLDPAAEANGYAADITFGVIGGDSVPASIAPKLAPATWNITNGRKWRFAGLCFVDATRIEGMGRMELVDCVAQQSATLQFACAGTATDCDFSKSTSVQIAAGADVYSNGTAWGNALSIVGSSASNRATLVVDNDVVLSPSVGLGGRLEMLGGKLRQRTGAAHSVGVGSGGELYCKGVRVEKADGTVGTISMLSGSTKAFVDVEYDPDNSSDNSDDASPEVYIRVRGFKVPVLNTNEIWVNHKSTIGSDTAGFGTLYAPYATVNYALSKAQYPCQIIVGVNSAAVTENVNIPAIATNLQIVASSLSDRNGLLSWSGIFSISFHATSVARHTWRGITFTRSAPFSVTSGNAAPVIAVENCSFVGVVGQIAPLPPNFIGTVTFRGIDMTSSPQGSVVIYNNTGAYNFENQHSGVAITLASGNTGAGVTITVNGSCSMGQIAVPLAFAGTLYSLQQEVPAVIVAHNQAALDAVLNSTNDSPPVFVLINGFVPSQNMKLRGSIIGHAAVGGVAYNWIERAATFVSPVVSDIYGDTWLRTTGGLETWVKLNEPIVSILTAPPSAATADGLHIYGHGASNEGLRGAIVRVASGAVVQRFFTYERAPAAVSVGAQSASITYVKSGNQTWSRADERVIVSSFLTTAPTSSTPVGLYVQVSGALAAGYTTAYALNDVIYVNTGGVISRAFAFADAPAVITVGTGATGTAWARAGAFGWVQVLTGTATVDAAQYRLTTIPNALGTCALTLVSGNMPVVGGNTVLLRGGRTYELHASPRIDNASYAELEWQLTDGTVLSTRSLSVAANAAGGQAPGAAAYAQYTPTTDVLVRLQLVNYALSAGYTGATTGFGEISIKQIGSSPASGFIGVLSNDWNIANQYPQGTIVVYQGGIYQANASIAPNTAFATGTTGATWRPLSGGSTGSVPNWALAGPLVIGATTTAPTKPTTVTRDAVYYRQLGPKTWQVEGVFAYSAVAGATQGVGDYLITLPNGLAFDQTILTQAFNTAAHSTMTYGASLPGSLVRYSTENYAANSISGILPYDKNRFRVHLALNVGGGIWGSTHAHMAANAILEFRFSFTFQSEN